MAKSYSVIEINGNRYDALTGQLLGTAKKISSHIKSAPDGVIDGFIRQSAARPVQALPERSTTAKPKSSTVKRKAAARNIKSPAQNIHKRAQKSLTLMRGVVSKPDKDKEQSSLKTHHIRTTTEIKRASRAHKIEKHPKINRFGAPGRSSNSVASSSSDKPGTISGVTKLQVATANVQAVSSVSSTKPVPSIIGSLSGQQLERLLDHALLKADSHKNNSRRRSARQKLMRAAGIPRWAGIGASLLIVVILGGFFAWQNVPQLSMQLAARRANIPASVPGYTPSGFSFSGPIGYSSGTVSIRFKANSDDFRNFTIQQEKSSWNSQSLAANSLPKDAQVQTSQVKGTTVYIYGPNNDATWVDRGIKYTIQDQASLTSEQILKIAGSL